MREELHGFVDRLDERDVKALARFAVIALGVLPFLPNQPMGPYGAWNPCETVVGGRLVTGFSFAGYVANRIFGERHGTIATALIGGAYSSTAVTQSLAQRLGSKEAGGAEPAGIALASAVMYLRVIVLVAMLATRMLWPFVIVIARRWSSPGWPAGGSTARRRAPRGRARPATRSPWFRRSAFLLFVAVAAVVARWAEGRFGEQGIAVLLLIMGSMDVDAAIVTAGGLPPEAITST